MRLRLGFHLFARYTPHRMKLIDTHCHLHFPAYNEDRKAVLARMHERGIGGITVGTALENSREAIRLAELHEDLWATVGLHPSHAVFDHVDEGEGEVHDRDVSKEDLIKIASSSKRVVAIGEAGLDYYRFDQVADVEAAKQAERTLFRKHLEVAHELKLPIVIHTREATADTLDALRAAQKDGMTLSGVVHSFTGTWEEAQNYLDLGMFIGINGIATFPLKKTQDPATSLDVTLRHMPLERLLLETDAPYLAPAPHRGKRNEPGYVEEVAKYVAKIRGMSFDDLAFATTSNAKMLFKI